MAVAQRARRGRAPWAAPLLRCPHPLRAALPPARALPALGPHGGAWGPLKRQRFPTSGDLRSNL